MAFSSASLTSKSLSEFTVCLTDDANQMFVFLLPQDVRTIFWRALPRSWSISACAPNQDNSLPHVLLLFHMRGGVRFLGVSLG